MCFHIQSQSYLNEMALMTEVLEDSVEITDVSVFGAGICIGASVDAELI